MGILIRRRSRAIRSVHSMIVFHLTTVSVQDSVITIRERELYESEIYFIKTPDADSEFLLVESDLFNDHSVRANAEVYLRNGQRIFMISSLERFFKLGWRPIGWWYDRYYHRPDTQEAGSASLTEEAKYEEQERLAEARQYIEKQKELQAKKGF